MCLKSRIEARKEYLSRSLRREIYGALLELTFFNLLIAAFSFCSHFCAERSICLETILRSIKFSSNETLFPIIIIIVVVMNVKKTKARMS